jgi:5-methylcytosine-specific restriction endonuclease McrA
MWIKKNGVYISISIFLGSIFLSWFKRKNYYNPDILKNTETVMNNINTKTKNRRNVSNSMKKIVASQQKWKCGDCANLLDYTYEIDHKIPLFKGGLNSRDNLIALCRLCHGRKTILEINNK